MSARAVVSVLAISVFLVGQSRPVDARAVVARMESLEAEGKFREAEGAGAAWLEANAKGREGAAAVEVGDAIERLQRLRKEFTLTREALSKQLGQALRDFKVEEIDPWEKAGQLDALMIDGTKYYAKPSRSNLFFRCPELKGRQIKPHVDTLAPVIIKHIGEVEAAAAKLGTREVLPETYEVEMTIAVAKGAASAGKMVRCWMPFPRALPHQQAGIVFRTTPDSYRLDDQDCLMRALYLEQPATEDAETTFRARYRYASSAVAPFAKRQESAAPLSEADRLRYTAEAGPHVSFTPEVREAAKKLGGEGVVDPRALARRFYDWIADNVKYSFSLEYSTTPNIPHKVLRTRCGDCGEAALLFISLCRLKGIPARWQSGWAAWPENETMHDWAEIWLEGEGWCPVDPYMGVYAATLDAEQGRKIRDFYFGGLDHWRLIANSDHGVPLNPKKAAMRSDTVDFQRGEVECDGVNIYYDQFHYTIKITPIEP